MNKNSSETAVNVAENDANITFYETFINATKSNSCQIETPSPYDFYFNLSDDFCFYALSVIIPCGLIGNFFSVCVFLLSSRLRRTTTGQYLVALAIADSTFLVGEMFRWFNSYKQKTQERYLSPSLGLNVLDTSNAACKMTYFLRYAGSLWSVWLTIAITVERLLAVAFPLKIGRISTLRSSRVVIVVVAVISCSLALFPFWLFQIAIISDNISVCRFTDKDIHDTWNTLILKFGTLIIPGVLIAVLTIALIVLLYRARSKRMSQLAVSTQGHGKGCSKLGLSTEAQLTIMLVAVCISTTALRAPYTIAYYFRTQYWARRNRDSFDDLQTFVAFRVTDVFNITNYAINFILYCLSGRSFRNQIQKTVCRRESPLGNA